jgi:hypothetical protein
MAVTAVHDLKRILEERFPNAVPLPERAVPQIATGVEALDGVLPGGGLPRGRLTVWEPGPGASAVLRAACRGAVERGERAAWVDGVGRIWPGVEWSEVVLARPGSEVEAMECVEELLRTGGFGLVVSTGVESRGGARVRLCRAAREGGSALVELSVDGHMAAVRLSGRMEGEGFRWRRNALGEPVEVESATLRMRVVAGGWSREANVVLVVSKDEHSLSVEPGLADRRGVAG